MRLDVCFVHNIEAIFIAEFIPPWMMRVVWVSHCIEVSLLPGLMPSWRALYGTSFYQSQTKHTWMIWGVQTCLILGMVWSSIFWFAHGTAISTTHLAGISHAWIAVNYQLLLLIQSHSPSAVEHQFLDIKQHILLGYGLTAQWVHLMDIGTRHGDGLPIHTELPVPNVHASSCIPRGAVWGYGGLHPFPAHI